MQTRRRRILETCRKDRVSCGGCLSATARTPRDIALSFLNDPIPSRVNFKKNRETWNPPFLSSSRHRSRPVPIDRKRKRDATPPGTERTRPRRRNGKDSENLHAGAKKSKRWNGRGGTRRKPRTRNKDVTESGRCSSTVRFAPLGTETRARPRNLTRRTLPTGQ